MTAYQSFSSRALIGVVIPALMLGCVAVVLSRSKLNAVGRGIFVIGFLVMAAFNMYDLHNWREVRKEFSFVLESGETYVSIDDTPLAADDLDLRHYRWSWNNPLLSLVWSGGCVRTIVLNSTRGPQGPFDPSDRLVMKRYLKYDASFQVVDPTVTTCVDTD